MIQNEACGNINQYTSCVISVPAPIRLLRSNSASDPLTSLLLSSDFASETASSVPDLHHIASDLTPSGTSVAPTLVLRPFIPFLHSCTYSLPSPLSPCRSVLRSDMYSPCGVPDSVPTHLPTSGLRSEYVYKPVCTHVKPSVRIST